MPRAENKAADSFTCLMFGNIQEGTVDPVLLSTCWSHSQSTTFVLMSELCSDGKTPSSTLFVVRNNIFVIVRPCLFIEVLCTDFTSYSGPAFICMIMLSNRRLLLSVVAHGKTKLLNMFTVKALLIIRTSSCT